MNIVDVLEIKFPGIDLDKDLTLHEHDDGKGIVIGQWNRPEPKPSKTTLKNWLEDPDVLDKYNKRQNKLLNVPLIKELELIDIKSIRALRTNDTARLTNLEAEASAIRSQLLPTDDA